MAVEVRVPTLGESIVEATVGKWLKRVGEAVAAGETIVDLETDKVNIEVAADQAGVLEQILKAEGANVAVGDVIGTIGTGVAAAPSGATAPTSSAPAVPVPALAERDLPATPVARRIATEQGVDLRGIAGSGPGGKVTKDDVAAQVKPAKAPPAVPAPAAPPTPEAASPAPATSTANPREERVRMTRRRQTIAQRLVEAQQTAAMLTTFNEVDMSAVMDVRMRRKDSFKERHGIGLGFMSFFTKAVVGALKAFPMLNAEIQGSDIVLKHYYDIGIAVGAEEGLVVPVLRDADRKGFAAIEREISDLAARARDGKLTLAELQGGTFTITNGGVFGSLMSTPILNTPQVGILGMHKIQERPIALNGQVVIRPMMYIALSYDHRIIDGSTAVRFLVRMKELVEDPEALLLES
ncbi:MAG TPA: 2-oxoglutarate dehydrogenase complex dihydrolipoyllysine-residue succinyltransferase [Kouleothrix sp.]|jgi:2-oxoglutarate dehydrogenase E2 component (dihydrolipoamide succinyltransferase)|nr:2-oxoglutarate dehydrogenase complex dihydrolipoyllysine-residue succinyltransferase [Kouleothrix sp.]